MAKSSGWGPRSATKSRLGPILSACRSPANGTRRAQRSRYFAPWPPKRRSQYLRQSPARPTARTAARPLSFPRPAARPAQPTEPRPTLRATARAGAARPVASPAVRLRAREAGIDLRQVPGTGPAGRITHEDLDAFAAHDPRVVRSQGVSAEERGRRCQSDRAAAQDR